MDALFHIRVNLTGEVNEMEGSFPVKGRIPLARLMIWHVSGKIMSREWILTSQYTMDSFLVPGNTEMILELRRSCIIYSVSFKGYMHGIHKTAGSIVSMPGTHGLHYFPGGEYQLRAGKEEHRWMLFSAPAGALQVLSQGSRIISKLVAALEKDTPGLLSSNLFEYPKGTKVVLRKMESIRSNDPGGHLAMQGYICLLLSGLLKQQHDYEQDADGNTTATDKALRVRDYILNDLGNEKLETVAQLAKRFFITQRTLTREFIRLTGHPVSLFIRHERLEWARRLIEEQHMHTGDVAFKVGYSEPTNFIRAFKHKYGYPPQGHK